MYNFKVGILPLLLMLCCGRPAAAAADVNAAARRAAGLVSEKPAGAEALFEKAFFRQVPLEKIKGIFSALFEENGGVTEVVLASSSGYSGHFFFDTGKGRRIPAAVSVDPASGLITGLFFGRAYGKDSALSAVRAEMAGLPGRKGLLIRRLGDRPETLAEFSADEQFSVGEVSGLYVLGAVMREKIPWSRVYRLRDEQRSLPAGRLRDWPDGSPLTAHTLAALMISENDNTASDALVDAVGRRKVEESLAGLGHSAPERMRPFLKTSEMFRLKSDTALALKYLNLPAEEKVGFLYGLAGRPFSSDNLPRSHLGVDRLGWFASPADVCRALDFFWVSPDPAALELLAVNPGVKPVRERFYYAGYKGGREPGVLSAAWLLKNKSGDWFCLTASWNDELRDPEEDRFFGLMGAAIEALAQGVEGTKAP